jgi:GT2 family glycosyltransferase/phosphatidylglycerophosphate synthase
MDAATVDVIVLNYNGGGLPAECLPTVVRAVAASRHRCRLIVIDNGSTDGSDDFIAREFPQIELRRMPNRGLCSFNTVLRESTARTAVLLNNDIKAADDALDPLVEPLLAPARVGDEPIAFTAPRCTLFDGVSHEGLQTAVAWRYGLVQATSLFDGAEAVAATSGPTASAGAVLAVDRAKFVALGGFDDAYLPGRIEDLDYCFRAFQAGYQGRYVAESRFQHRGGATFQAAFGRRGCDRLALRNTLIFQGRHLRHPAHRLRQLVGLTLRAVRDLVRAPFVAAEERFAFCRACLDAWKLRRPDATARFDTIREREFFARHAPQRLAGTDDRDVAGEEAREARHPLSRWYLLPIAHAAAARLARLGVRPNYVTAAGLACAVVAAMLLVAWPHTTWLAAALIGASWFCDRTDGPLARRQGTAGPLGAWIDANVDEFVDLGLHTATAAAAAQLAGSPQPWFWLIGFLVGKYLLMHGLTSDEELTTAAASRVDGDTSRRNYGLLQTLYHLPANADVRAHLLIVAVAAGWLTTELALIAVYYNVRWIARYVLLVRRFRATAVTGATP